MKILLSWLKDYVPINKTAEVLAEDLSMFAHEVESITPMGEDAILDLEITPNRGDCLSHLGIARQVAAMYNQSLAIPEIKIDETKLDKKITVKIANEKICPRYTARIIDNIKICESPQWLKDRITAYGFRPINNIVDITNYVMIATGQPLHAFDYDKISGGKMDLRLSKKGEKVTTLDGKDRVLPDGAIVIEDDNGIFDLAGVMGGASSEISPSTKTIILQGAIFDPILIRRTSKFLHHQTDASYRYERGVDFEGTVYGINMAADLILKTSPSSKIGQLIDRKETKEISQTIQFSSDRINRLIGINLDQMTINSYLERLYFKVSSDIATVPSFRIYDVSIWQDLAEEVTRVHGFDKIQRINPVKVDSIVLDENWQKRETIKDILKEKGFSEVYTMSFASVDKIKLLEFDLEKCAQVINPIAPETKYLRPDLSFSILSAISKNPWAPEINIFEIEKVFFDGKEHWQLGIAVVGKNNKVLEEIKTQFSVPCDIVEIKQDILDAYKIRRSVHLLTTKIEDTEFKMQDIDYKTSQSKLRPISKYPPTIRDISIVVDTKVTSEVIQNAILGASSAILLTEKFDEFISDKFGTDKKSLAFHIWLQDLNANVKEDDANKIIKNILDILDKKYQAKLRS